MILSKRLLAVVSYVKKGSRVLDVGSDHAEVPIYLLSNGLADECQAVENKIGPYKRMEAAVTAAYLLNRCSLSLSDGISQMKEDIDTIIIAGMGGSLIVRILNDGKDKLDGVERLIIDAHTDIPLVRKAICELGFFIKDETFLYDSGKPYTIILFEKGTKDGGYSEQELSFGPILLQKRTSEWIDFLKKRKALLRGLIEKEPEAKGITLLKQELSDIEEVVNG
ncbi:MAG: class I SAM-dependent methyltransferase [Bacilli bacterium]|jgi:tRNA (adenine22-N1)-methyltransferase|nr:class I SAM-dependent methyltransferase [Bacilli bacterium]MCH4228264.1 class I SAM-dependent methyltransferase [Bacilli bacterium]MCH4277698.1 class I SAM-dependent methyltransferase [Bacilli bacterium]MCI2054685.1 class I SAM-dependent methyltransferase [Bacilli bacterium]